MFFEPSRAVTEVFRAAQTLSASHACADEAGRCSSVFHPPSALLLSPLSHSSRLWVLSVLRRLRLGMLCSFARVEPRSPASPSSANWMESPALRGDRCPLPVIPPFPQIRPRSWTTEPVSNRPTSAPTSPTQSGVDGVLWEALPSSREPPFVVGLSFLGGHGGLFFLSLRGVLHEVTLKCTGSDLGTHERFGALLAFASLA